MNQVIVNGSLGSKGAAFMVVLLDAGPLIIHMPGGDDSVAGAKPAGSPLADSPTEDPLHLMGTTEVKILSPHFLEEDAPAQGAIRDWVSDSLICRMER
jgi:hypothetical protein